MIIVYTISVISSFLVIFFGTHIYFRNPKSQRSTLLLITTIMISLLGIFKYNMIHSASRFEATIWAHLSFIWPFIVSTALHFSLLFTEKAKKDVNRIRSAVLIYLPAVILVATDLITGDISRNLELRPENNDWHRAFEVNPLYIATFIWLISSVVIFTYLYMTHLLSVKSKVKKNITFYFFAGFTIAGLGGIAGELGPVFISKHMNYLFVPSAVISCIIILYGLIRHYDYSFKSPEAADIIIDTISDALIYITPDLEVQPVNSAALNLFGWNEIENTRLPIKSFLPENPEYGQTLRPIDSFEQLVEKLDSREVWTSLTSRNKTEIAVSVSGRVIKKHNKNPMGLLLTVKDIREKIKDKHKIKLSNHRYYELLQNLPLGIIRVDTEGKILDVNNELVEMLGSPSPEETKKINMFTYPPLIESGLSEDLMKCFRTEDKLTGERRYKTKWGKELYMKYYLLPLFDDKNQCTSVQAIVEDNTKIMKASEELKHAKTNLEKRVEERTAQLISINEKLLNEIDERKKVQKRLASEMRQLDITLKSIGDAVITTDSKGEITLANNSAQNYFNLSESEITGKNLREIFRHNDKNIDKNIKETIDSTLKDGTLSNGEMSLTIPGGLKKNHFISYSCAPIKTGDDGEDETIIGMIFIFRDITAKKQIDEELYKSQKLESVGQLAAGIAHDFNNLMTGIITNLFIAKSELKRESRPFKLIQDAEKAAYKSNSLTRQLLSFAEGGELIKAKHSVKNVLEDSIGFFLDKPGVNYSLDVPDDLWLIDIDKPQFDQTFKNILSNASESMDKGGNLEITAENIHNTPEMELPLQKDKYVKITVKDSGCGIPRPVLSRIFDPFFSTKEEGSGMGLTTAYAIIKKHNGHIEVDSSVNSGTEVSIYLEGIPDKEGDEMESDDKNRDQMELVGNIGHDTAQESDINISNEAKGKRILLMDDDKIIRMATEKLLNTLKYDAVVCDDGQKALELYKEAKEKGNPFDLVILDLTVPGGMGGKKTIDEILKFDPEACAIVSSGYSNDPVISNYKEYGFKGVVKKPYQINTLNQKIQELIMDSNSG